MPAPLIAIFSVIGIASVLASLAVVHYWFTTAWIVVHPWNLGRTREEMEKTLRGLNRVFVHSRQQDEALLAAHEQYYLRLAQGLRWAFCRHLVVCDEPDKIDETALTIADIATVFPMCAPLVSVGYLVPLTTRPGRATLLEHSWQHAFRCLHSMGVRRVYVSGCYLGVCEGELVPPQHHYFCLNDVVAQARATKLFKTVEPFNDLCYLHQVRPNEVPLAQMLYRRKIPRTSAKKKKKKGRK